MMSFLIFSTFSTFSVTTLSYNHQLKYTRFHFGFRANDLNNQKPEVSITYTIIKTFSTITLANQFYYVSYQELQTQV